ncbi:putative G-protein coupled receptor 174 isoform X3 [Microtus pennsylvanicus]|uniref:putative G-protein coupled receptor 174 isoform X3 n=1 Tax=Microtus pennsylvanicus TaxID=10058 RepID=UPI003F6C79D4
MLVHCEIILISMNELISPIITASARDLIGVIKSIYQHWIKQFVSFTKKLQVEGLLDCFQFLAIMNKSSVNIGLSFFPFSS